MSRAITQTYLNRFHSKLLKDIEICHTYAQRFFRDTIQYGCQEAILYLSTDSLQSWYKDIYLCHTYAHHLFPRYNPILPPAFYYDFVMSRAITLTCLNWFLSKLVQGHRPMSYMCTLICFMIQCCMAASVTMPRAFVHWYCLNYPVGTMSLTMTCLLKGLAKNDVSLSLLYKKYELLK